MIIFRFRKSLFIAILIYLNFSLSGCDSSPYKNYTPEPIGVIPIEKTRLSPENYRLLQEKSPILLYILAHISYIKPELDDQALMEFARSDQRILLRLALAKKDIQKFEAVHLWERDIKKDLLSEDELKGFWQTENFFAFKKRVKGHITRTKLPQVQ